MTGKVRLSYVHVFEPYTSDPEENEPRYSAVLIIPKSDKKTISALRKAQQAALEAGKDTRFNGKIPKVWKDTIHDGDEEADLDKNPEYEGCWYMNVSSKTRPAIADRAAQPILDQTEVYSGCYARVKLGAFAFAAQGSKGVSFGLNGLQKLADGEPLGAVAMKAEDFEAVEDDEDEDESALI
jgi:hypothetical protein